MSEYPEEPMDFAIDEIKRLKARIAQLEADCRLATSARDYANDMLDRERGSVARLEAALAKEKGGWDAFYKLRKSVGEDRYPGMTAEVTASETLSPGSPSANHPDSACLRDESLAGTARHSSSETRAQQCEWVFDDGQYIGSCDPNKFINISPAGMTYCPYCGRPVITSKTKVQHAGNPPGWYCSGCGNWNGPLILKCTLCGGETASNRGGKS
jgi:hypothetical protein